MKRKKQKRELKKTSKPEAGTPDCFFDDFDIFVPLKPKKTFTIKGRIGRVKKFVPKALLLTKFLTDAVFFIPKMKWSTVE